MVASIDLRTGSQTFCIFAHQYAKLLPFANKTGAHGRSQELYVAIVVSQNVLADFSFFFIFMRLE